MTHMISPNLSEYKKHFKSGKMVAIYEAFPADLETPVSAFLKIAHNEPNAFLLESAIEEQKIGRYSILGIQPEAILEAKNGTVTLTERGKISTLSAQNALDFIQNEISNHPVIDKMLFPGFPGGYVGYCSYENIRDFEKKIKIQNTHPHNFPDSIFFRVHEFLVFDHFRKTLSIVIMTPAQSFKKAELAYEYAQKRIRFYESRLNKPLPLKKKKIKTSPIALRSNFTQKGFETIVKKAKEYIRAGDIIQVVLSQRFEAQYAGDAFQIYRSLRSINPSPYMFYFRSSKTQLVGSSPEVLVKKTGQIAELRPIAGTRPRGKNDVEDLKYEKQLLSSKKELAEHVMLVDLGRNDLGRVSDFKTVSVNNYAHVERYSHVMHLVSNVCSRLNKKQSSVDLLRAVFPAGTVSGAPKIRAMEIIDELENDGRGPYAGCLGYFGFNGDMDMCITIRTMMLQGSHLCLQAGAGIVKDSNPKKEYEETISKAKAVMKAIEQRDFF